MQFNAIFADQGLPKLGYMNDLLYIASAIAPASFNDVTLGNNISSFHHGRDLRPECRRHPEVNVMPTGFGYYAGPGYDMVTGLGCPTASCWGAP